MDTLPAPEVRTYITSPGSVVQQWLTSDSEVSDSEMGLARKLQRTQARLRLAAANLLVCIAKVSRTQTEAHVGRHEKYTWRGGGCYCIFDYILHSISPLHIFAYVHSFLMF